MRLHTDPYLSILSILIVLFGIYVEASRQDETSQCTRGTHTHFAHRQHHMIALLKERFRPLHVHRSAQHVKAPELVDVRLIHSGSAKLPNGRLYEIQLA